MRQREPPKEMALSTALMSNERQASRVRIEHISSQSSRISKDDRNCTDDYIKKLEAVILKYEDIIVDNHGTIEELQDKVCEYLKDALDKEL